jgi:hypothetical protein
VGSRIEIAPESPYVPVKTVVGEKGTPLPEDVLGWEVLQRAVAVRKQVEELRMRSSVYNGLAVDPEGWSYGVVMDLAGTQVVEDGKLALQAIGGAADVEECQHGGSAGKPVEEGCTHAPQETGDAADVEECQHIGFAGKQVGEDHMHALPGIADAVVAEERQTAGSADTEPEEVELLET